MNEPTINTAPAESPHEGLPGLAARIQSLRKSRGLSQEELADRLFISRQAVSKWEGGQSSPDPERLVALSELFGVSTDYLLKGSEPSAPPSESARTASRVLYASSVAFIAIGLLCGIGSWAEEQSLGGIFGAMVIQAVGGAAYFIGRALSTERAGFWVKWPCIVLAAFMPLSLPVNAIAALGIRQLILFLIVYLAVCACVLSWAAFRKGGGKRGTKHL